jgi:hypothetical protein
MMCTACHAMMVVLAWLSCFFLSSHAAFAFIAKR